MTTKEIQVQEKINLVVSIIKELDPEFLGIHAKTIFRYKQKALEKVGIKNVKNLDSFMRREDDVFSLPFKAQFSLTEYNNKRRGRLSDVICDAMKEMELELTDGVTVEEIVDYINKNNMYRFERKQKDGEFWAVRSLIQKDIAMNQALSKYEALGDRFKLRDSENIQDLDMGIVPTEEEEKLWNQVKKSLDEVLKCIDISQEMGQVTQDIATTVLQFGIEESQVDSKMKDLKRKEKKKEIMNNAKEAIFRRRSIVVLGATASGKSYLLNVICRLFMVRQYWWLCLNKPELKEGQRENALKGHELWTDLQLEHQQELSKWQSKVHKWTELEKQELDDSLVVEEKIVTLFKEYGKKQFPPDTKEIIEANPFISPIATQSVPETNFAIDIRFGHIPAMIIKRFSKDSVSQFTRDSVSSHQIDNTAWEAELTGTFEIFIGFGLNVLDDRLLIRNKLREYSKKIATLFAIERVTIYLPVLILQGGSCMIDAPGSNDSDEHREQQLQEELNKANLIWTISENGLKGNKDLLKLLKSSRIIENMLKDSLGHGMITSINVEKMHPVSQSKILERKEGMAVTSSIAALEAYMQADLKRLSEDESFSEEQRAQLKAGETYMKSRFEHVTSAFYPTLFLSLAMQYQDVRNGTDAKETKQEKLRDLEERMKSSGGLGVVGNLQKIFYSPFFKGLEYLLNFLNELPSSVIIEGKYQKFETERSRLVQLQSNLVQDTQRSTSSDIIGLNMLKNSSIFPKRIENLKISCIPNCLERSGMLEEGTESLDMVECVRCKNWAHLLCINQKKETVSASDWKCPNCSRLFEGPLNEQKLFVPAIPLRKFVSEKDATPCLDRAAKFYKIVNNGRWTVESLGDLARVLHVSYKIRRERKMDLMKMVFECLPQMFMNEIQDQPEPERLRKRHQKESSDPYKPKNVYQNDNTNINNDEEDFIEIDLPKSEDEDEEMVVDLESPEIGRRGFKKDSDFVPPQSKKRARDDSLSSQKAGKIAKVNNNSSLVCYIAFQSQSTSKEEVEQLKTNLKRLCGVSEFNPMPMNSLAHLAWMLSQDVEQLEDNEFVDPDFLIQKVINLSFEEKATNPKEVIEETKNLTEGFKSNSTNSFVLYYQSYVLLFINRDIWGKIDQFLNSIISIDKTKLVESKFYPKSILNSEPSKPELFPKQIEVGKLLLQKLHNFPSFKAKKFKKFSFIVIVPNFTSLYSQSVKRLKELLQIKGSNLNANQLEFEGAVLMLQPSDEKNFDLFVEKAKAQPDCLFLMIQDECHWGVGKGQTMDKWLKKIINIENIFLLQVSATPWNCLISLPNDQRVVWEADLVPQKYISRQFLFDNNFCVKSNTMESLKKSITSKSSLPNQISTNNWSETFCLLVDYCVSMHSIVSGSKVQNEELCTPETKEVLKNIMARNPHSIELKQKLIAIRVNTTEQAGIMCHFLELYRDKLGLKGLKIAQFLEKSKETNFNAFADCPCILILVGKGRIGDTLPDSLCAIDLRCRYPNDPPHQSTLFQDIGRACGYRDSCTVLLSPIAYNYDQKKFDRYVKQKLSKSNGTEEDEESDDENGMNSNFKGTMNNMWSDNEKMELQKRLIMLAAQPQIGKTGAFISMLIQLGKELIYEPGMAEPKSKHTEETKKWAALAEKDFGEFQKKFSGIAFDKYHRELIEARKNWSSWSDLETSLHDQINLSTKKDLVIADCGCGMDGLFKCLQRKKIDKKIHIFGFDVDDKVKSLESESRDNLKFTFSKGDMCQQTNRKFDIVLYSLSFWQRDITRHIAWASDHLQNEGILYIVQNITRMPANQDESLSSFGFQSINNTKFGFHHLFSYRKIEAQVSKSKIPFLVNFIGAEE